MTTSIEEALRSGAVRLVPVEATAEAGDLVSRAEVIRVLRRLGGQDADLALYGAEDNARAREYGEAAMTRACCAIAIMPAASDAEFPKPQRRDGKEPCGECHIGPDEVCDICGARHRQAGAPQTWQGLDDARLQLAINAFYEPCEGTTIDGVRAAILAWEQSR